MYLNRHARIALLISKPYRIFAIKISNFQYLKVNSKDTHMLATKLTYYILYFLYSLFYDLDQGVNIRYVFYHNMSMFSVIYCKIAHFLPEGKRSLAD